MGKHEAKVKPDNQPQPAGTTGTPGYAPGTLVDIAPAGYTAGNASLADWRNPSDIEFGYYFTWTHMIAKVEQIAKSPEGVVIEMAQPGFFLCHRKGGTQAGMPAYMENALELLDEPGEWYFDRPAQTLYYLPRPGEDMARAEVIAPTLELLVELKGTLDQPIHDLRFDGLTFAHATWLRPSTRYGHPDGQANFTQPVDNGYFRPEHDHGWVAVNIMGLKSPANVIVDAGRNIRLEGCTFTALGGAGLDLQNGSQDNIVSGCLFYDISGSGIQVGDVTPEDHHPSDPRRIVKGNQITNNRNQNRIATCRVHDNYTDGPPPAAAAARKIMDQAGLESAYEELC